MDLEKSINAEKWITLLILSLVIILAIFNVMGSLTMLVIDKKKDIIVYNRKLENDFAAHKNSVIEKSTGDYIFHIDADEYPSDALLLHVKPILEANDIDLIWVPRINTVDGLTESHIQKWGWRVTENKWVNYRYITR